MEFSEKLQQLRKQRNLTQEELAEAIYVSRTAISKWESGRGYPSVDSLKALSKFFSVPIDTLLSGEQVLLIAEDAHRKEQDLVLDLVFGLLDCCNLLYLFLPFFWQVIDGSICSVSLLCLSAVTLWIRVLFFVVVIGGFVFGILSLALQSAHLFVWTKCKRILSCMWNSIGVMVYIMARQPYAAVFLFVFLMMKLIFWLRKR